MNKIIAKYNKDAYSFIDAVLSKMFENGIPYPCILFHGKYNNESRILHLHDFNKKQWKEIIPFEYKWHNSDFSCIITYDARENLIYLVKINGYTAKYNCNENKWTILEE